MFCFQVSETDAEKKQPKDYKINIHKARYFGDSCMEILENQNNL